MSSFQEMIRNLDMSSYDIYYKRRFLNESRGRAYTIALISGELKPPKKTYKGWHPYIEGSFEIADCSKTIYLEFFVDDLNKKADREKIKRKLKRFREEFEKFENVILDCIAEFES